MVYVSGVVPIIFRRIHTTAMTPFGVLPRLDPRAPVVLSIRPTYIRRILEGLKTVELRRRFPQSLERCTLLFYSTAPVQAIVAHAVLEQVKELSLRILWQRFSSAAAVTRDEFDAYFQGATRGCALQLRDISKFPKQIHLSDLTRKFAFCPPQSYCYWREPLRMTAGADHDRVEIPS